MVTKELLQEAYQYAMQHPELPLHAAARKYNIGRATFCKYCAANTTFDAAEERLKMKTVIKRRAREASYKEAYQYAIQHPEIPLQTISLAFKVGTGNFSQYYREHASLEVQQQRKQARGCKIKAARCANRGNEEILHIRAEAHLENKATCRTENSQEHDIAEERRLKWVHGIIERRMQQVREQRRNAAAENRERLAHGQDIKER